jgi:putative transcriptional regulator
MSKTRTNTYRSAPLAAVHEIVEDLHTAGVLGKQTMRKFDDLCLTEIEDLEASQIKALRESAGVSQTVFARVMNVTASSVSQWERGEKKPTGSALKLLMLARKKGLKEIY